LPERIEVRINEAYCDYAPRVDVTRIVRDLLASVPDRYLSGLDCVVLTNDSTLSRRDRIGRPKSRKRRYDKSLVIGRYHPRWRGGRPYIELRVDKILAGLPGIRLRIPFLRNLVFGHVLFHEIGHHIHHTVRPEHDEKEDVADSWAARLNVNFVRKRYWYAMPIIIPFFKVYRALRRRQWI
jgi:hypothetical protein